MQLAILPLRPREARLALESIASDLPATRYVEVGMVLWGCLMVEMNRIDFHFLTFAMVKPMVGKGTSKIARKPYHQSLLQPPVEQFLRRDDLQLNQ